MPAGSIEGGAWWAVTIRCHSELTKAVIWRLRGPGHRVCAVGTKAAAVFATTRNRESNQIAADKSLASLGTERYVLDGESISSDVRLWQGV